MHGLLARPASRLNSYFAMPYRKGARITITNEGARRIGAFYSNIDFAAMDKLPDDALYFHAQYHQEVPCQAVKSNGKNLDGKFNHVYCETHGRGQLIGVTLGVIQNAEGWWGEGDEMIFVDDESKPVITGTGSEDFFCGSWNFGGREAQGRSRITSMGLRSFIAKNGQAGATAATASMVRIP